MVPKRGPGKGGAANRSEGCTPPLQLPYRLLQNRDYKKLIFSLINSLVDSSLPFSRSKVQDISDHSIRTNMYGHPESSEKIIPVVGQ